jgi:hypothetical protein
MEASTSISSPLPPAHKSTADRTVNDNELHAHTNPLNSTFPKQLSPVDLEVYEAAVERAEAFFLAQEHNPKEYT